MARTTDREARAREFIEEARTIQRNIYSQPGGYTLSGIAEVQPRCIALYTRALKLCPTLTEALVWRAMGHHKLHHPLRAAADARRAFSLNPADSTLYFFIATAIPHPDEKREVLRHGMGLVGPDDWEYYHLWMAMAQSYWYQGDFLSSAREWENLVATEERHLNKPRLATHLGFLANNYQALGDYDQAEAVLRKALALSQADAGRIRYGFPGEEARMIVRNRLHKSDYSAASLALEELGSLMSPLQRDVLGAIINILTAKPVPNASETTYSIFGSKVSLIDDLFLSRGSLPCNGLGSAHCVAESLGTHLTTSSPLPRPPIRHESLDLIVPPNAAIPEPASSSA